jgi:DNA primase
MRLPDSFMEELKVRCDMVDIVSEYVKLKKSGKNYSGLCPFHHEKTPSFFVFTDTASFHCFGCGAGGDVISFIMKIENLGYMDALRFLAQKAGIDMPENGETQGNSDVKRRIYEINREAAKFYHQLLMSPEGKKGLDYFRTRCLSIATIKHFGLGYAPDSGNQLVTHLKSLNYNDGDIISANLGVMNRNSRLSDRFTDRAMFPIIDQRGNVVAFGGRRMDNNESRPKYLNSSETAVYHKGSGLFAMNYAKNDNTREIVLVEGYMDAIALHAVGIINVVASLGTALTDEQATVIKRYADSAVICYDSDEPGQKAAMRAIPILRQHGLKVRILTVPGNKDPDEFIKANGQDGAIKFRKLIESCPNDIDYRLKKIENRYDMDSADGKLGFLGEAVKMLATLGNPIEEDLYSGRISAMTDVEKATILDQVVRLRKENQRREEKIDEARLQRRIVDDVKRVSPQRKSNLQIANAEEALISYMIDNPENIEKIYQKIKPEEFATDTNRRLYNVITQSNKPYTDLKFMDISGELTEAENSLLAKIIADHSQVPLSGNDAEECIGIIKSRSAFMTAEKIKGASDDDLRQYMEKLKKDKNKKQ